MTNHLVGRGFSHPDYAIDGPGFDSRQEKRLCDDDKCLYFCVWMFVKYICVFFIYIFMYYILTNTAVLRPWYVRGETPTYILILHVSLFIHTTFFYIFLCPNVQFYLDGVFIITMLYSITFF